MQWAGERQEMAGGLADNQANGTAGRATACLSKLKCNHRTLERDTQLESTMWVANKGLTMLYPLL